MNEKKARICASRLAAHSLSKLIDADDIVLILDAEEASAQCGGHGSPSLPRGWLTR